MPRNLKKVEAPEVRVEVGAAVAVGVREVQVAGAVAAAAFRVVAEVLVVAEVVVAGKIQKP